MVLYSFHPALTLINTQLVLFHHFPCLMYISCSVFHNLNQTGGSVQFCHQYFFMQFLLSVDIFGNIVTLILNKIINTFFSLESDLPDMLLLICNYVHLFQFIYILRAFLIFSFQTYYVFPFDELFTWFCSQNIMSTILDDY